ncbi:hypothetical protein HanPI659440_Chr08g0288691 [Helianthus annuus]|nr:hypothetical protein HanIR_Chr08g0356411 [Helianthus annuus]KAJ0725936.1 hypothetical protein HanPI659440_Chr12g0464541 [Helianthus annuus]KAJ0764129.1 hypothetical protein HanPI659440_Chr08g0288691 [Helianthus annuus]
MLCNIICTILFRSPFLLPTQFSLSELDLGLMRREGSGEKDSPATGGEEEKNNATIH